jgi:hypothetical protein
MTSWRRWGHSFFFFSFLLPLNSASMRGLCFFPCLYSMELWITCMVSIKLAIPLPVRKANQYFSKALHMCIKHRSAYSRHYCHLKFFQQTKKKHYAGKRGVDHGLHAFMHLHRWNTSDCKFYT